MKVLKHISSKTHLDIVAWVQNQNVKKAMDYPNSGIRTDMLTVVLAIGTNHDIPERPCILIGGYGPLGVGMIWLPFDYGHHDSHRFGFWTCPHVKNTDCINAHRASMEAESRALKWIRARTF